MLKYIIFIVIFIIVGSGVFLFFTGEIVDDDILVNTDDIQNSEITTKVESNIQEVPSVQTNNRIIKKPFGIFIMPETSPVQPERFQGYHTGVDFEIFEDELGREVKVKAICDGDVIVKRSVSGYGGVLVQECVLNEQVVTVLYGHLNIDTMQIDVGEILYTSDVVGLLGDDNSKQTDFERKHLHMGIHKGNDINFQGYVQNKESLNAWIDVCIVVKCTDK